MENFESVAESVVAPVIVETVAPEAPVAEKVDRRQGKRRIDHADGSVSYGLKADGTPRSKPGRRKAAPVVEPVVAAPVAGDEEAAV